MSTTPWTLADEVMVIRWSFAAKDERFSDVVALAGRVRALLAERDELREALGRYLTAAEREVRPHHTECHDMDIPAEECPTCSRLLATYARDRAIISRHPAQPVKGTP